MGRDLRKPQKDQRSQNKNRNKNKTTTTEKNTANAHPLEPQPTKVAQDLNAKLKQGNKLLTKIKDKMSRI